MKLITLIAIMFAGACSAQKIDIGDVSVTDITAVLSEPEQIETTPIMRQLIGDAAFIEVKSYTLSMKVDKSIAKPTGWKSIRRAALRRQIMQIAGINHRVFVEGFLDQIGAGGVEAVTITIHREGNRGTLEIGYHLPRAQLWISANGGTKTWLPKESVPDCAHRPSCQAQE